MTTAYEREKAEWVAEAAMWKIAAEGWKAVAESYQRDLMALQIEPRHEGEDLCPPLTQ